MLAYMLGADTSALFFLSNKLVLYVCVVIAVCVFIAEIQGSSRASECLDALCIMLDFRADLASLMYYAWCIEHPAK
jgi:hypothetical protein